ncbi:HupE/UreJ family protein [Candidatus Moduliflexota bacterium]
MNKPSANTVLLSTGVAASAVLLQPSVAAAHLVTTGMGPVYDGIGHLLLTPEDLVPAMAVAMYAGLRGKEPGRLALFFFPLAWLIGGFAGLLAHYSPTYPLSVLSFLLLGALIAADLRMPASVFTLLVVAVGIMHGFFNGIAMNGGPGSSGLLGIAATLFVLIAIASAVVVSLRATWTRVAVRVAGSWIAAVGLLMLGWLAKGNV